MKKPIKKIQFFDILSIIFILIIILSFYSNIIFGDDTWGMVGLDSEEFAFYNFILKSSLNLGQIPLWNPFHLGGLPYQANPQTTTFYFTTPLIIIFGEILGMRFSAIIHLILAGVFMYILTNYLKINRLGRVFSSILYAINGMILSKVAVTHFTVILAYTWVPLIFLFYLKLLKKFEYKFFVILITIFSLQFLAGNIYISIYTIIFLFLYTLFYSFPKISLLERNIFILISFLILSFLLVGIKLFPIVELYFNSPRGVATYAEMKSGYLDINLMLNSFFNKNFPEMKLPEHGYWEYYAYFGPVLILAFIVLFLNRKKITIALFLTMIIFLIVALGKYSLIDIFGIFHKYIPFFNSLRIPARSLYLTSFILSLMVGICISSFIERAKKSNIKILLYLIIILFLFFTINDLFSNKKYASLQKMYPYLPDENDYHFLEWIAKNDKNTFEYRILFNQYRFFSDYYSTKIGLYQLQGYETFSLKVTPDLTGNIKYIISEKKLSDKNLSLIKDFNIENYSWYIYQNNNFVPRSYLLRDTKIINSTQILEYENNFILVHIDNASTGDKLVLMESYYPGWNAYENGNKLNLTSLNGLRVVNLDRVGSYNVRIAFESFSFYLGLLTTITSIAIYIALFIYFHGKKL